MARWRITGADASTGDEISVTIEASDRAAAEKVANYNGILVANVEPADSGTTLDYYAPGLQRAPVESLIDAPQRSGSYEYLVVRFDPSIPQKGFLDSIVSSFQAILNGRAVEGWEYMRMDHVRIARIAARLGPIKISQEDELVECHFVVFRRRK